MQKPRDLDRMIRSVAESGDQLSGAERRNFLKNGLALLGAAGAATAGRALAADTGMPPGVPPWTKSLGAPVNTNAYGVPSKHEAHVSAARWSG
jgi:sulfane dehydrogenase subunit SoxC